MSAARLSKLAAEFGISGTALAALRKKHQVLCLAPAIGRAKSLGIEAERGGRVRQQDHPTGISPTNCGALRFFRTLSVHENVFERRFLAVARDVKLAVWHI